MKLYKLTDENGQTYNNTQWGENITHETSGKGELCGPGWLHAYTSPDLALLLNPIHACFKNPILWECEGTIEKSDKGLKVGTTKLTTIRKIPLPTYTTNQKIAFGILCALKVYKEPTFIKWAKNWLHEKDRTIGAAEAAEVGAWSARSAAKAKAADAAAWSAKAAADAAAQSAEVGAWSARSAAQAAEIDLQSLAKKALTYN